MTWANGGLGRVAMGFETAFGVTPASPTAFNMPFNKSGMTGKETLNSSNTITGRRDPVAPFRGNKDVSGNLVVPVDARGSGHWLKAMFGVPTTTGTSAYQHVYKVGNTQPSFYLEQGFTDVGQYFLYNGCKVSKAGFSFGGDGELTASIDVMGAKETLATSSVDSTLSTFGFDRFASFQAALKEGGATVANIIETSFDIDFGLDGSTYCIGGNGFRSAIAEGLIKVSGKIKAMFQDATLLNKAINGTESSLQITLTNGTSILDLLIQELVYERATPGIDGPQGIFVELPFQAYFDNGAGGSVVTATLTNDVATYA